MKQFFSVFIFSFTWLMPGVLFSFTLPVNARYPVVSPDQVDQLFCYMQTGNGTILNLGTLCGHSPRFYFRNCPTDIAANLTPINVSFSGDSLSAQVINQTCKTFKLVKINYEVLDNSGNLIDSGFIESNNRNPILPGQSADFRGTVTRGARVQPTYVEWEEQKEE